MKYINKTIEYGLYLLVFLLPIQTRWIIKAGELNGGYWEYGTLSLYGTDILLVLLLLFFTVYKIKQDKFQISNFKSQIIWWLIAGLELVIFISIFAALNKPVAIYGYVKFLLGVGLFWLIVSAPYKRAGLIYGFIAGAVLQAGLGIYQFFSQSAFASKWLGMAAHNGVDLGASVVETLDGARWLRAYGGLDHPNVLGGLLVIGLLCVVYLLIQNFSRSTYYISHITYHISRKNILLCAMCCVLCVALFFTFSRGAWLGLFAGITGLLVFLIIKKELLMQKRLLYLILAASIGLYILFNLYTNLSMTRLSGNARLEIKSSAERMESLDLARSLIKDNFFLGVGIGNYTNTLEREITGGQPAWYYQPVHNFFLLVLAEIGVFGLLMIIFLFYHALSMSLRKGDYLVFSLLLAILTQMLFDHWYWSLHFGVLLFWLVIGLAARENNKLT